MSNILAFGAQFFTPENLYLNWFTAVLLFFIGVYCMAGSRNMLRTLIGIEISSKGCMFALLSAGYAIGNIDLAQALIMIMIGFEVVVVAVGLGLIIRSYNQKGNLDILDLKNLRG
ncbi:Putative Ech hydrogenase component [Elusimicrobium minutum Pei191]|uniref:Putative Ech hydrogenase component n=1 Tax=Elusimicrobium minutum (strain Pei191) TaxID=445932 RepID=B2KDU0_ELUMP|nr:NADH-quinone oxidoreductase subunit K [Elusimicrobium minutum]ACC98686.1 Putative Ech hydrogenase component [Elusimicrobium minutum Pei191]